jgi:MFS transporter, PPP family, 3-phenylpropionic acid transporter
MRAIKRQYLLMYAATGAAIPYLPVLLEQRLADRAQVGDILAITGLAIMVTPVIVGFLADAHVSGRALLAALSGATAVAAAALTGVHGFWSIAVAYALFSLVFWPQSSLADGFLFSVRQQRLAAGLPSVAYYRVRVYGTIGFIVPGIGLYALMARGATSDVALLIASAVSLLGLVNALTLPRVEMAAPERGERVRAPTLAAARALSRGPALVLCASMFLGHLAAAAYYGFYPIYLTAEIGFASEWVGVIFIAGVLIELGMMFAVGALVRALGLKGALVLGLSCSALRFAIMALAPSPFWAVATQGFHGVMVITLHVLPPMYLDGLARDAYRTSMQGLYTMAVVGLTRLVGNQLGGRLADISLLWLFGAGAAALAIAAVLMLVGFREPAPGPTPGPAQ